MKQMDRANIEAVEVFFSYSHKDEELRDELSKHLAMLKRQNVITAWHDRRIGAGKEWENEIDEHLNTADIILLLISSDFLASDYCYDVEMKTAMRRHDDGEAENNRQEPLACAVILEECARDHASTALPLSANRPRGRFWMNTMIATSSRILPSTAPA